MKGKYQPLGIGMAPSATDAGRFLRARRLELGLRQTEIADRIGMHQAHYSSLESGMSGHRYIHGGRVDALAKVLQCDPADIQKFVRPPKEPQTILGSTIRARRLELGLEIADLAEKADLNKGYLAHIELGTRGGIHYATARKLASALGLDIGVFAEFIYVRGFQRGEKKPDSALGAAIRARRKELGLSIKDLAVRLYATPQLVSLMELGKISLLNDTRIKQVADALEMDTEVLYSLRSKRKIKAKKKTPPVPESLAAFVYQRRVDLGITQKDAGVRAGMSAHAIGMIEQGMADRLNIDAAFWDNLATGLACDIPRSLISDAGNTPRKEPKTRGNKGKPRPLRIESATQLGAFVAQRRLALGMTRHAAAALMGIMVTQLFHLESGQTKRPRLRTLEKIACVLQCDVGILEALVPGYIQVPPIPAKGAVPRSEDAVRIMDLAGITEDEAQRKGVQLLRRLLERQRAGYSLFFAKEGDVVELELLL